MAGPSSQEPARLLAIMGSGETTPTMVKLHRQLFDRLGPPDDVRAALVDTPYGFQSNASDISARAVAYFRESIGRRVEVASLRRAEDGASIDVEAALAKVAEADWVFAGPGSPTYALRQWRATVMPKLLEDKLSAGGCVIFASAAALTLGQWTVPVYEIYKAGTDPRWERGLGLLQALGLDVAVIPHYDNAEGGNHDTRYCYLGQERLRTLEEDLPDGAWVLGVDEHTALVLDLVEASATVYGRGGVSLRHRGHSVVLSAGEPLPIPRLNELALSTRSVRPGRASDRAEEESPIGRALAAKDVTGNGTTGRDGQGVSPLIEEASRLAAAFDAAMSTRDAHAATEAVLAMEELVHGWAADTFESEDLDRARAQLRRMVLRLGETAGPGLADPRDVVAPFVEALLEQRAAARESRRYADADRVREVMGAAGVEVRDTADGPEWYLK